MEVYLHSPSIDEFMHEMKCIDLFTGTKNTNLVYHSNHINAKSIENTKINNANLYY